MLLNKFLVSILIFSLFIGFGNCENDGSNGQTPKDGESSKFKIEIEITGIDSNISKYSSKFSKILQDRQSQNLFVPVLACVGIFFLVSLFLNISFIILVWKKLCQKSGLLSSRSPSFDNIADDGKAVRGFHNVLLIFQKCD